MVANGLLAKARFRHWRNKVDGSLDRREAKYATMFNEAFRKRTGEAPAFYPTAGAANYSLLYTIMRCVTELPVTRVLELGMGQSTVLLDALGADTVSVDHEEPWVQRMGEKVKHQCVYAPLVERQVHGFAVPAYDFAPSKFDLVLVDGPQGTPRRSRWCSLDVLDKCLGDEFIVIFDDAARRGEQDTVREFLKSRNADLHLIQGSDAQIIAYSPKFAVAKYF
jgi:hypothetical protein